MPTHEIMSTGEALFWFATWPVLLYLGLRFTLLNLDQCARLEGDTPKPDGNADG